MDEFSKLHPIICLIYFFTIIFLAMFLMHPILIIISFIGSCTYFARIKSFNKLFKHLKYMLPFFIITGLFNSLFNSQGSTILINIFNFTITFESVFYGCMSALNLISIITWFSCFNSCFDSGKIMFLFSKFSPSIALLFTSSMRTIESLKQEYSEITKSKILLYGETVNKDFKSKIREAYENILMLISWAFESSIYTSISMRSRGLELPNKTNYSNYSFKLKDIIILILNLSFIINTIFLIINGAIHCEFFPKILISQSSNLTYIFYLFYILFCLLHTLIDSCEVIRCLKLSKLKT